MTTGRINQVTIVKEPLFFFLLPKSSKGRKKKSPTDVSTGRTSVVCFQATKLVSV